MSEGTRGSSGFLSSVLPRLVVALIAIVVTMAISSAGTLDRFLLLGSLAIWLLLSWLVVERLRSGPTKTILEPIVVLLAILVPFVPAIESRRLALDQISRLERNLASSSRAQLHRAILETFEPYNDPKIREALADRNRNYSRIEIDLFEIKYAGIMKWILDGVADPGSQEYFSFPFGSNVPIPSDASKYVSVTELRGPDEIDVKFEADRVWAGGSSFLYQIRFPGFVGDFRYQRTVCHPTSQTLHPEEAFVLSLDLIEGEIEELVVRLFVDEPVRYTIMVRDPEYSEETGEYDWKVVPGLEQTEISDQNIFDAKTREIERWSSRSVVYGTRFFIKNPNNDQLVVIYSKGESEENTFLGNDEA